MAIGPTTGASIADLRAILPQQEPRGGVETRENAGGEAVEGGAGRAAELRAEAAERTPDQRGENGNPGTGERDGRLPSSGDPNRGSRLDISV